MAIRYVDLPLFQEYHYQYSTTLEDNSYILEFAYNERMRIYTLSLQTADNNPLLSGVGLLPMFYIAKDYGLPNLSGFFLLAPKSNTGVEFYKEYPDQLAQYYNLMYVYEV